MILRFIRFLRFLCFLLLIHLPFQDNKIANPGSVTATYPVAAIGIDQVSDTVVSNNEVIISKGNTSKSVYLLGGCDPDTVRIDNNPTSHTP